jgi:pilus assembly protein Flp/PilA
MSQIERNEAGATAAEYGLMVALIAAVIIATVIIMGGNVAGLFQDVCGAGSPFNC